MLVFDQNLEGSDTFPVFPWRCFYTPVCVCVTTGFIQLLVPHA